MALDQNRIEQLERERVARMDRSARRFFLDLEAAGLAALSAPNRTAFDDRHDFQTRYGNSAVEGGADGAGFLAEIVFAGRRFEIVVRSVPIESVTT